MCICWAFAFASLAWHIEQTTSKSHYDILCDRFHHTNTIVTVVFLSVIVIPFFHICISCFFFLYHNKQIIQTYRIIPQNDCLCFGDNVWKMTKKLLTINNFSFEEIFRIENKNQNTLWYLICFPFQSTHKIELWIWYIHGNANDGNATHILATARQFI